MARVAITPPGAKKSRLSALAAISALFLSGSAIAQDAAQSRDQERSEPRSESAARNNAAAGPNAETPAPPPDHVRALTEREKRCRQARGCAMQGPCEPCDR